MVLTRRSFLQWAGAAAAAALAPRLPEGADLQNTDIVLNRNFDAIIQDDILSFQSDFGTVWIHPDRYHNGSDITDEELNEMLEDAWTRGENVDGATLMPDFSLVTR